MFLHQILDSAGRLIFTARVENLANQRPAKVRASCRKQPWTLSEMGAFHNGLNGERRASKADQTVSISVASRITGVEVHTLRYWEKEFAPLLEPFRTDGGQRRYRPEDIQTVFSIKRLLRDDMFSIAGARRHLARTARVAA